MQSTKKPRGTVLETEISVFLLLIPSLVWVILICYAPMTGLYMSFINYTPQGSGYFADMANSQFVGLDWFKYFFSTDFTKIMRNTLATSLLTLLFSFPLPIILALCLNEVRNQKAKKFVQTASYIPYFISWVIAANIFPYIPFFRRRHQQSVKILRING